MRNTLTLKSGNITLCCSYTFSSRPFKVITVRDTLGRVQVNLNNLKQDLTISSTIVVCLSHCAYRERPINQRIVTLVLLVNKRK